MNQPPRYVVARVRFDDGPQRPESARLVAWLRSGQRIIIGTSEFEADWQMDFDGEIGAKHLRLAFDGLRCQLQSLDLEKGTFVNGEKVNRVEIKDGDSIKAGQTVIGVEVA